MRTLFLILIHALTVLGMIPAIAQPLIKSDAIALLQSFPSAPISLEDAWQRACPDGKSEPDARLFYQSYLDEMEGYQREGQALMQQFYLQNPLGVTVRPSVPNHPVSSEDQMNLETATAKLAQKMLNDPAFAAQFMRMSEKEQHAYMASLLADEGLKPASGQAEEKTLPGMEYNWMELCQEINLAASDMTRWEAQIDLQLKNAQIHDAIELWVETEIKKLPLITFGEYGQDYDPAQVDAVRRKGMEKHLQAADQYMKDMALVLSDIRSRAKLKYVTLNEALQAVDFGHGYDFGQHYLLVLQAQLMMLGEVQTILQNELNVVDEVVYWVWETKQRD
ncbi:MAG TPA: hypothetical protein PKA00_07325 [Saprospiraceae bacterium]|nr:hypothetical protein [Saprospiraceae bacterium]HMQ82701.1 hypothetical protein [Saprospiraceae bacterium]